MIKHGKIYPIHGIAKSHLKPIAEFVTKGVADSKENITLTPKACDVKGAKRFNGQECVIAKALTRTLKPQAVAIGRSTAFAVFNGLAVRFLVPKASRLLVEEFDQRGRARSAPIDLCAPFKSQRIRAKKVGGNTGPAHQKKKSRMRPYGVRAVGGGIEVPM